MSKAHWTVYVILCSDGSLYTGMALDVEKRFRQHLSRRGAKYFRRCAPLEILFTESGHDHASAARREAAIKRMTRRQKLALVALRPGVSTESLPARRTAV